MTADNSRSHHLCPWQCMWIFDNRFRLKIHPGKSVFSKYVSSGDTVMDMGCGIGGMSLELGRLVGEEGKVIAADIQKGALKRVRARARREGLENIIETRLCNEDSFCDLPEVSFLVSFWTAHETISPKKFIAETGSCLAPKGMFMLVEPKGHVNSDYFKQEIGYAISAGYRLIELPDISLSHAAVFIK